MSSEVRHDLGRGGSAAVVAVASKLLGVGVSVDDVAQDLEAGDARDVADHEVELEVHLDQGLLHALNVGGGALDQGFTVTQKCPQRRDGWCRTEAAAQQTDAVQLPDPLTVADIALAAWDVLDVPSVHEYRLQTARFQDLVDRDPVDAGGFHGDRGNATGNEPVGEALQVAREGLERTYRIGVAIGGYGHVVLSRPAVDPGCIGVDAFEKRRRGPLGLDLSTIVFHGDAPSYCCSAREQGCV